MAPKSVTQTEKPTLSASDLKLLRQILEVGHHLEKIWPLNGDGDGDGDNTARVHAETLNDLTQFISNLDVPGTPVDPALQRLAFHARNLSPEMSAKHLAGILVPFERLLGKALRDDEFIVVEGDLETPAATIAPLRVIADNLRSAFNVGAIFRTAECYGVEEVVLTGYTPTPDEDKTAKTSLGTQDAVKWSSQKLDEALSKAAADGYAVVALETVASATSLPDFVWPKKSVLLLGNERFGLGDNVMKHAKHFVRIPLFGKKNSLNVGIACGIALADWRAKLSSAPMDANKPHSSRDELKYNPIGNFAARSVQKYEAPRQGIVNRSKQEGVIRLDGEYTQALKDLEGFERIWIVYDFHHNKNWKPLVRPPRGSHEKRGVFATRAPYRPNAIGLSCVELVRIETREGGRDLLVRGHDLLDGTPILDIKPYIPYADSFPESRIGWLEGIEETKFQVGFTSESLEKIEWLEANGVDQLRGFLVSQLEFDPIDSERKRVSEIPLTEGADIIIETARRYQIAYRTWRADFKIDQGAVIVNKISSGYTAAQLDKTDTDYQDKYEDKDLHRRFLIEF